MKRNDEFYTRRNMPPPSDTSHATRAFNIWFVVALIMILAVLLKIIL